MTSSLCNHTTPHDSFQTRADLMTDGEQFVKAIAEYAGVVESYKGNAQ